MSRRIKLSDRKRRPDSWDVRINLSDDDARKIFAWARSLGYARALQMIRTDLKIVPPSMTAFQSWYEFFSKKESEERVRKAIADGLAIRDLAQSCDVSEAMAAALENEASAAILSGDPDRIKLLVSLALKAREGRFNEKKYRDTLKSSIERGLDALAEQTKENPDALKHYTAFRETILKSVAEVTP
jgi:hypothetical protein